MTGFNPNQTDEELIASLDDGMLADALSVSPSIWSTEEFHSLLLSEGYRRKIISPKEEEEHATGTHNP